MPNAFTKYWWVVLIRGALAVLFGVLALIWPGITLLALVVLFGAFALVDGVITLGTAIFDDRAAGRRLWLGVQGVLGIGAGIVTFVWPDVTTLVLLWLIAFWAIATGIMEVVAAIRLRREIQGEWLLGLSGVASVLFGLLLVIWPASGALALIILIGIYAITAGVLLIMLGLRLRSIHGASASGLGRPATA
jgi:uncharacterized membrane protein HdeD (DUF308 family)